MKKVSYSVAPLRCDFTDKNQHKYYAVAHSTGKEDIEDLAEDISLICTVTRVDIVAVLSALNICVAKSLQAGHIVELGELGNFRLTLNSKGEEKQEDFTSKNILRSYVRFHPGSALRKMMSQLKYQPLNESDPGLEEELETEETNA